ncbi:hypothetical protein GC209_07295 [bacterium]|nr:hypothetical protein [bacterium]
MRYLEYLDLAPCLTINECADWLAFGRLPRAEFTEDRSGPARDYRQNINAILDHQSSPFEIDLYFNVSTLARIMPGVDPLEYHRNYEICEGQSPDQVRESRAQRAEQLKRLEGILPKNEATHEFQQTFRLDDEVDLAAAIWLERAQAPLKRMLERAQTDVFQALADARVTGIGLFMPLNLNEDDEEDRYPDEFTLIPSQDWTFTGIDWDSGNLKTLEGTYLGVTVDSGDFLRQHPVPRLTPEKVVGNLYGETFIPLEGVFDLEAAPTPRGPRRGAPTSGENLLRDALLREFEVRFSTGKLPEKTEAILFEAQAWVEQRLGVPLARTTAQRYLEPVLKRLPRKAAQK